MSQMIVQFVFICDDRLEHTKHAKWGIFLLRRCNMSPFVGDYTFILSPVLISIFENYQMHMNIQVVNI